MIILIILIEFICGSLMFSYWLGRLAKKDIKNFGDGNPGGYNLWVAAGYKLGIIGILLDFLKGFLPLLFFISNGYIKGIEIVPAALAAILGHAFSPFVKFKGGRAVAVTFGVWSAVSLFEISIVYALILGIFALIANFYKHGKYAGSNIDGVITVIGMLLLGPYIAFRGLSVYFLLIWIANFLILTYTNRNKLINAFNIQIKKLHFK